MSVTRLPSGRWRAQVYDPATGKNLSVSKVVGGPGTFATKTEAKRAREKARERLGTVRARDVTVRSFLERWTTDPLFARPKESSDIRNITKLPAADAEKHELASTFYVDGAIATQSQNGVTNAYQLDPNGRARVTTSGGKELITHYDGAGEAVAWTCELTAGKCESASKWTRNIPGIDGTLAAVQTNGGAPELQLHDLKGDIVATASLSKEATKLLSTYNSTEFGVPNAEKAPPTFAWLGAGDISRSLSSGVITYGATSYVPQTGLPLQTEQVDAPGNPVAVGGGAPATFTEEPWVLQGAGREASEAPGIGAGEEREAVEAMCRATPEACLEDPHFSGMETAAKMSELAEGLRKKAANGTVYSEYAGLVPVAGEIAEAAGMSYTKYLEMMAANAEGCSNRILSLELSKYQGQCYIKYWYETLKINVWFVKINLEWPLSLSTEICGKKQRENPGYYYCWGQKAWFRGTSLA